MENQIATTLRYSIQALGRGFDVTSDIRLLYCKGAPGSRLVHIDEDHHAGDLVVSDGVLVPNVSVDIECSKGNRSIERIPVCSFHEVTVSQIFNLLFFFFLCIVCWLGELKLLSGYA